jgi:ParB/RepB/Spo0J family partition protein
VAELKLLPVELIDISPHNPRGVFDDESLHSLADSIARLGVLQPILVKSIPEQGRYEIVAGERRWRASCLAQRSEIPALVIDVDVVELHEVQLVENLQREQLNPIEEALALAALQAFGSSDAALAQRLKRSLPFVRSRLNLLKLDPRVQQMVGEYKITIAAALELNRLDDPDAQFQIAQQITQENLTVSATATRVNRHNFEQRLAATRESRRLSLEHKLHALAEHNVVVTAATYDAAQHHRVWDLIFDACEGCQAKGVFLRADGQVEEVCVMPNCYNSLLTQQRAHIERVSQVRLVERQRALENVLDSEDVTSAHLQYILWTMLNLMGPAADDWRGEHSLLAHAETRGAGSADWNAVSSWPDEQVLTNILRLCVSHFVALSNDVLPSGLKQSLIQNFGVNPQVLGEEPVIDEAG